MIWRTAGPPVSRRSHVVKARPNAMSASWRRSPLCPPHRGRDPGRHCTGGSHGLCAGSCAALVVGRARAAGRDRSPGGRVLRPTLTLLAKCVQRQRTSAGQTLGRVRLPPAAHIGRRNGRVTLGQDYEMLIGTRNGHSTAPGMPVFFLNNRSHQMFIAAAFDRFAGERRKRGLVAVARCLSRGQCASARRPSARGLLPRLAAQ
jgi:hypothetical protein